MIFRFGLKTWSVLCNPCLLWHFLSMPKYHLYFKSVTCISYLIISGDVTLKYYVENVMKPQTLEMLGNGKLCTIKDECEIFTLSQQTQ